MITSKVEVTENYKFPDNFVVWRYKEIKLKRERFNRKNVALKMLPKTKTNPHKHGHLARSLVDFPSLA